MGVTQVTNEVVNLTNCFFAVCGYLRAISLMDEKPNDFLLSFKSASFTLSRSFSSDKPYCLDINEKCCF